MVGDCCKGTLNTFLFCRLDKFNQAQLEGYIPCLPSESTCSALVLESSGELLMVCACDGIVSESRVVMVGSPSSSVLNFKDFAINVVSMLQWRTSSSLERRICSSSWCWRYFESLRRTPATCVLVYGSCVILLIHLWALQQHIHHCPRDADAMLVVN